MGESFLWFQTFIKIRLIYMCSVSPVRVIRQCRRSVTSTARPEGGAALPRWRPGYVWRCPRRRLRRPETRRSPETHGSHHGLLRADR